MSVGCYQTVYETTLQQVEAEINDAEAGMPEMRRRLQELEKENRELNEQNMQVEIQLQNTMENLEAQYAAREKMRAEERNWLLKDLELLKQHAQKCTESDNIIYEDFVKFYKQWKPEAAV